MPGRAWCPISKAMEPQRTIWDNLIIGVAALQTLQTQDVTLEITRRTPSLLLEKSKWSFTSHVTMHPTLLTITQLPESVTIPIGQLMMFRSMPWREVSQPLEWAQQCGMEAIHMSDIALTIIWLLSSLIWLIRPVLVASQVIHLSSRSSLQLQEARKESRFPRISWTCSPISQSMNGLRFLIRQIFLTSTSLLLLPLYLHAFHYFCHGLLSSGPLQSSPISSFQRKTLILLLNNTFLN